MVIVLMHIVHTHVHALTQYMC